MKILVDRVVPKPQIVGRKILTTTPPAGLSLIINFRRHTMRYLLILIFTAAMFSACQKKSDVSNPNVYKDEQYQQIQLRVDAVWKFAESDSPDAWDKLEQGARALQTDFPTNASGFQLMMLAMRHRERGERDQARVLAKEMTDGSAPERFKLWAKGFLHRLDSMGKPVTMQFVAADGREVDLAKMRGRVVLVDFWSTRCGPCVAEMPRVKAAFEKFHGQGLEVVGISCDTDKKELENFVEKKAITWPQYFEGKQQADNKFAVAFGIDGIPHMFLVDRQGCLRVDNMRAKGDFEEQIAKLLAEH